VLWFEIKMAPTYSIIIPHHGPQEQLERCVASIPKRDDVQLIVVIDKDCHGAGWARNEGLKQVQGRYVIFADSDDYFLNGMDEFLDDIKDETSDMIFFNACSIDGRTGKKSWRANHINSIVRNSDKVWQERHLRYHFTEPWCRVISMSMIKKYGIRFGESSILNDIFFATQVGCYAKDIVVYDKSLYCITNNKGSVAKRRSERCMIDATRQTAHSNIFLRNYGANHYHSRMMRPFVMSLCSGHFNVAKQCWRIMLDEGYSTRELLRYMLRYPKDVIKLLRLKIIKGEIFM